MASSSRKRKSIPALCTAFHPPVSRKAVHKAGMLFHFELFQVNGELFSKAEKHTGLMHCLPAHRGVEVTDEVIDHENSWVYQQAKNRMIVSKAVFALLLNESVKENYWPKATSQSA